MFVDYSPPASPSLDQQRDALRKGQGRAVQWALAGRLNDEPLLEACLTDHRHDWQIDATRGDWLWAMVQAVGAADRFRVAILHALYELSGPDSGDQLCQLGRCYAMRGDEAFRSRLYEIVEQRPFPTYCPCFGEEEIIQLDGEPAFLFAAKIRGRSLRAPGEWDDGSLGHFAVERFGENRVNELLNSSSDPEVAFFRECWRRTKLNWAEQRRTGSQESRMAAISVAEILQEAEGQSPCYRLGVWGKHASEADLRIILQRLWTEQEPQIVAKLLRVFSRRALPGFDSRLIDLCKRADGKLRWPAYRALSQNSHPLIHEFARAELQSGLRDESLADLFIKNFRQGDEQPIWEALEIPGDRDDLHGLLYAVIEVLDKNPQADCSQLGLVCYALSPCGNCRFPRHPPPAETASGPSLADARVPP